MTIADKRITKGFVTHRMVYVEVMHGLGNQMFQYAAARALALRNETDLRLNVRWYHQYSPRTYGLKYFNIVGKEAGVVELLPNLSKSQSLKYRITGSYSKNHFVEKSLRFDQAVLSLPRNAYLRGYYQSERYFADYADRIRQDFALREELPANVRAIQEQIQGSSSVSIHVRRGDYITEGRYCPPISYYQSGKSFLKKKLDNPRFFIFTDDPEWVEEEFDLNERSVIVSRASLTDYQEMFLMSQCDHHIIANSTFSWWGAWLNPKTNKIVIAPKVWETNDKLISDIVPESWVQL